MKKFAFAFAVAAASVFALNAEPVGIDVGSDFTFSGLGSDTVGVSASPWVGYAAKIAGIDPYFTAGVDMTLVDAFSFDDVYIEVTIEKSFDLAKALSLDTSFDVTDTIGLGDTTTNEIAIEPVLTFNYALSDSLTLSAILDFTDTITMADETTNAVSGEPGLAFAAGAYTTTLTFPMDISPDFSYSLCLDESASFGDLSLEAYADIAVDPEVALSDIGVVVGYPLAGIGFEAECVLSGFDTDLVAELTLSASYSF